MTRCNAFTLAEVLITLGIIGVVAAMTMPTLIQKHKNTVIETRLKKFYSVINQAILLAEADYGDKTYWFESLSATEFDNDGNPVEGATPQEKWINKYLVPYLKVIRKEKLSGGQYILYFEDGSALRPTVGSTADWYFYPSNPKKCFDVAINSAKGACSFYFLFAPTYNDANCKNKGMEPYKYAWDGNLSTLYDDATLGCKNGDGSYCTAIIQMNGWKIPKDYPRNISY